MISKRIRGADRVLGAPKDWDPEKDGVCTGLAVRFVQNGPHVALESAWEPTPEELEMLNAGGVVILGVLGGQPPVYLTVEPPGAEGPVPEPSVEPKE